MSDIELVIKIDKDIYEARQHWVANPKRMVDEVDIAIANGIPLPKRHGRLIDADKVENITWQEPYYHDALNVLTEVRDKVRELPTIIEADLEEVKKTRKRND